MKNNFLNKKGRGFSLVEILVGVGIFLIIGISTWEGFGYVTEMVRLSRLKVAATSLANEQLELVRNLPYADVGVIGYTPPGILNRTQEIIRDSIPFNVTLTINNIDDPFDGLANGTPPDTSPADYKLVEVQIACADCRNFLPVTLRTTVAPKNLESASTNGSLFIRVINANGQPVAQADVSVYNNQVLPIIDMTETTNNNGWLQLVDVPPAVESYQITASKTGYSTDQTYPPGDPNNPNPIKPHATVVTQQVTQITFAIDKVSTINVQTVDDMCVHKGSVSFNLLGSKLIGLDPNVYKYEEDKETGANGLLTISDLEWDNYSVTLTDESYLFAGSIPISPFALAPDSVLDLFLIVKQVLPKAILVKVMDASTLLPLSGATVNLQKPGWEQELQSGRGYLRQTDWAGGANQENFIDQTKYWSQDNNLATSSSLTLVKQGNKYRLNGWLISSTFDTGSATNFYNLVWQPLDQPPLTEVKFQIATSDVNPPATWDFLGPDGTANTYYTISDTNISSIHNGDRYLRYKIFLLTSNDAVTPTISDVAITFSSYCIPSGQSFFHGLPASGNWTLTISKSGYQTYTGTVDINQDWQEREVFLSPSF